MSITQDSLLSQLLLDIPDDDALSKQLAFFSEAQFTFDHTDPLPINAPSARTTVSPSSGPPLCDPLANPLINNPEFDARFAHHSFQYDPVQPFKDTTLDSYSILSSFSPHMPAPAARDTAPVPLRGAAHDWRTAPPQPSRDTVDEERRRRNTEASARFRQRKKAKEQALARMTTDLTAQFDQLKRRVEILETENAWLRGILVDRDGSESTAKIFHLASMAAAVGIAPSSATLPAGQSLQPSSSSHPQ